MQRVFGRLAVALLAVIPAPASALEEVAAKERSYCPGRPGMGTTPCTMDTGRLSVELGLADWQRDDGPDGRSDDLAIAPVTFRLGLSHRTEALVAWTPYGRSRFRAADTGAVDVADGVGDVVVGAKHGLRNPDGSGLSIAVLPFVSLPVGREPIGAGRWEPGIALPVSYALSPSLSLQATPQINAAPDADLIGRHPVYTMIGGLGWTFAPGASFTAELMLQRDDDPAGRDTQRFGAAALAWQADDNLQFDLGTVLGLDAGSPDIRLYAGISRLF